MMFLIWLSRVTLHNEKLEHVYMQENEYKSWLHCVLWELSLATLLDRLINYTQVKNWLLNSGRTIFSYTVFMDLEVWDSKAVMCQPLRDICIFKQGWGFVSLDGFNIFTDAYTTHSLS